MGHVVGFFIKYLTQQNKKRFDCSFLKFWGAEISADPPNDPLQKRVKNLKKAKKS